MRKLRQAILMGFYTALAKTLEGRAGHGPTGAALDFP